MSLFVQSPVLRALPNVKFPDFVKCPKVAEGKGGGGCWSFEVIDT